MITLTISGENATEFMQDLAEFLSVKQKPTEIPVSENGVAEEPKTRKTRTPKEDPKPPVTPPVEDDGLSDDPEVTYTLESIRALGQKEAKRVGAETVRGLIKSLGCDSLPTMPADKWAEFAEKVVKLTK
jgi:hypothetical protein